MSEGNQGNPGYPGNPGNLHDFSAWEFNIFHRPGKWQVQVRVSSDAWSVEVGSDLEVLLAKLRSRISNLTPPDMKPQPRKELTLADLFGPDD